MNGQAKTALLGALGGATIALVIVFGASAMGLFPNRAVTEQTIHDYLLANPELAQQMADAATSRQQAADDAASQAAIDKIGLAAYFDPKVAFVTGPADAKRSVVEFFDYNCPYCRASLPAMKSYYAKHKNDTRFSFIEFPIKGEDSVVATRAMLAARRQPGKYLAFHFALMSNGDAEVDKDVVRETATRLGLDVAKLQADMNDPAIEKQLAASLLLAKRSKIAATPTFIFNGKVRPGAVDSELLAELTKPAKGT
jgi:protein-disulfide isomerase